MQKFENVLSWASELGQATLDQAALAASMPFVEGHLALMPDAHIGMGATIGSVIPTLGAIIPSAVGVDIGCGMIAVQTNANAQHLPDDLTPLLSAIGKAVPAGVGQGHEHVDRGMKSVLRLGNPSTTLSEKQTLTSYRQCGTLGSGNHFVEVCLDEHENVWVVLHSGSRGIGNQLARFHIDIAKGDMKKYFIDLPDPDLAYFVQGTDKFESYMKDLMWAQDYALLNREVMMDAVLLALHNATPYSDDWRGGLEELQRINCHHNYTAWENHRGKNIMVTRKGAIRARPDDWGVIPGSMGTSSFIVQGQGNPASYDSAPHGAGRQMSRSKARKELSVVTFKEQMAGQTWQEGSANKLIDEAPGSYKDIHQVLRDSADLVVIKAELVSILNYKGTK